MSAIDLSNKRIGFIGAGQMAEALALGFVNKGGVKASNVYATDINQDRKDVFAAFGANASITSASPFSKSRPRTRSRPKVFADCGV